MEVSHCPLGQIDGRWFATHEVSSSHAGETRKSNESVIDFGSGDRVLGAGNRVSNSRDSISDGFESIADIRDNSGLNNRSGNDTNSEESRQKRREEDLSLHFE